MSRPLRSSRQSPRSITPKRPLPADVVLFGTPQLELFPNRPVVESLDPRTVAGPRTGVIALFRVRLAPRGPVHLVFHDRHGWYCELHGAGCAAVSVARK